MYPQRDGVNGVREHENEKHNIITVWTIIMKKLCIDIKWSEKDLEQLQVSSNRPESHNLLCTKTDYTNAQEAKPKHTIPTERRKSQMLNIWREAPTAQRERGPSTSTLSTHKAGKKVKRYVLKSSKISQVKL